MGNRADLSDLQKMIYRLLGRAVEFGETAVPQDSTAVLPGAALVEHVLTLAFLQKLCLSTKANRTTFY